MISKCKGISDADNVPFLLRIIIFQHLENLDLYLPLLVKLLLIL